MSIEAHESAAVGRGGQILIRIVEIKLVLPFGRRKIHQVFTSKADDCNPCIPDNVGNEGIEEVIPLEPTEDDSQGMQGEIGDGYFRWLRLLEEPAGLFRTVLLEQEFEPNARANQKH